MNIITTVLALLLVFYALAPVLRRYPVPFYVLSYLLILPVLYYYQYGLDRQMPQWFNYYFVDIFRRGIVSTALFFIVMFLGCVTKPRGLSRRLLGIRGELSIIASFMALCHNVAYGIDYFVLLFTDIGKLETYQLAASIVSLLLIALMLPLMLSSFRCIRRRFSGKAWKNLQKLAYPFYFLIYLHIMIIFSKDYTFFLVPSIIYSLVFLSYLILRLRKYFLDQNKKLRAYSV